MYTDKGGIGGRITRVEGRFLKWIFSSFPDRGSRSGWREYLPLKEEMGLLPNAMRGGGQRWEP